jgi:hypothetical protein
LHWERAGANEAQSFLCRRLLGHVRKEGATKRGNESSKAGRGNGITDAAAAP